MERMAQRWNIEMSQAFYMEVWNGYERSKELEEENKKLKEKVRFLEECLDRKEKLNEKYRKEIDESHVYDAKQVRDIC